jgi:hypothetical protein
MKNGVTSNLFWHERGDNMDGGLIILLLISVPSIVLFGVFLWPCWEADSFLDAHNKQLREKEERGQLTMQEIRKRETRENQGE